MMIMMVITPFQVIRTIYIVAFGVRLKYTKFRIIKHLLGYFRSITDIYIKNLFHVKFFSE